MTEYLILRLTGPMQAWGQPTFEGTRPSAAFPTRSGLLGLLGACLGIRRDNREGLQKLSDSVRFAVRCDQVTEEGSPIKVVKITDYHTVQDARASYTGLKSHETIQTWREYLCDASFTVAVWTVGSTELTLDQLAAVVKCPIFTPYLGRRSCPLTRPLYVTQLRAGSAKNALDQQLPSTGVIYSEAAESSGDGRFRVRDEPIISLPRQFAAREWFVLKGGERCS
jgi:CRISPR system Cascade subunit CasD